MCFARPTTSVSRSKRPRFPSSPPRIAAVLDLENPDERAAHDFIRRAATGRWPMWRLLGMRRTGHILFVAVEWTRWRSEQPFSLVEVSLDEPLFRWRCYSTAAELRAALAALDVKAQPRTAPTAPALIAERAR